jgi:ankyrin repeat protein
VNCLLNNGANIHQADSDGETPLLWAARYGHIQIVELLLENGADIHQADSNGRTPLHVAANAEIVKLLLDAKALTFFVGFTL